MKYNTSSANTATFSARDNCPLSNNVADAINVHVNPMIGVPVFGLMSPSHAGASRSAANMIASRDGTSIVPFRAVMIAMIAPNVTNIAAPDGRYIEATSAIGASVACNRDPGSTQNETIEVKT